MFKINFLAVFFSLFTLQSYAQTRKIGLKANISYSHLINNSTVFTYSAKGEPHFSGSFGFWREQQTSQHSYWGLEFLWSPVIRTSHFESPVTELDAQGNFVQTGYVKSNERAHISYLAIPVYYLYRPGRWGFKGGAQVMIPLFSVTNAKTTGVYQNQPINQERSTKQPNLNYLDIGMNIGIEYGLNSRFRLTTDYYHGLANIHESTYLKAYSIRQICLGLAYTLNSRNSDKR